MTTSPIRALRAHARALGFVVRLLPLLPAGPIDRMTRAPVVERVSYPGLAGDREGVVYKPAGRGPHPAVVMCLGVVPFGVEHPQIPRLQAALARFGFLVLIHWSPSMRELRLVPEDADEIALAYDWLVRRPDVDPARSGLYGACVGGAFALLAAAQPLIRERVGFVGAFAPFSSMNTLITDIASATCSDGGAVVPWEVDQLTKKVFVRSLTFGLPDAEAEALRAAYEDPSGPTDTEGLGPDARAVQALLHARDRAAAEAALGELPSWMRDRLARMSPLECVDRIAAPLILFGHDRDDRVIPVGESRRLARALSGRVGTHYTEYAMFEHADPTKRKLSPVRLAIELRRFYLSLYPMFRQATA